MVSVTVARVDAWLPASPSLVGPDFTVRYETVATVAGGCGNAQFDAIDSTITFHAG